MSKDLIENICVAVRIRNNNYIKVNENSLRIYSQVNFKPEDFTFDKVFTGEAKHEQNDIYEFVGKSIVDAFSQGYNCTILAYGQTGCFAGGTKILTSDGILPIEAVKIGSYVVGDDFTYRYVHSIYRGFADLYLVESNGCPCFLATKDHMMTVLENNAIVDIPIEKIGNNFKNYKGINKYSGFFNFTIRKYCRGYFYGIGINGNQRFLLANGIITHNSGKTYTMFGGTSDDEIGLIPRIGKELTIKSGLKLSMVEIYCEKIYDVLSHEQKILFLRESQRFGWIITEATEIDINNIEQFLYYVAKGFEKRKIASTAMNDRSSRSHLLTILEHGSSKLFLIDLAGSEKLSQSKAQNLQATEAIAINKSLSALNRVIHVISSNPKAHVPFRDSILTKILTNSIGGSAKTSLIATINGDKKYYDETVSTLRYAKGAKSIKNNVHINKELPKSEFYEQTIEELREQLRNAKNGDDRKRLEEEVAYYKRKYEEEKQKNNVKPVVVPTQLHKLRDFLKDFKF